MPPKFSPVKGAQGFQQSNPCILAVASLRGSLKIFQSVGMMRPIRERSVGLTGALEKLLKASAFFVRPEEVEGHGKNSPGFTITTPSDPSQRGAQLSLLFLPAGSGTMEKVFNYLTEHGVIGDEREPDVIRLSPAPLYNTLKDCERSADVLEKAFASLAA